MSQAQEHYNWIMNIIDSCNNTFHFECIDNLIELFQKNHNNKELTDCLRQIRNQHWKTVHNILN
jgi:hypothetical protein